MTDIQLTSVVVRTDKLLQTKIDQETVLFDYEEGKYFGLNPVATAIWAALETEQSAQEICTHLQHSFEVSESQCKEEVLSFLKELHTKSLITVR